MATTLRLVDLTAGASVDLLSGTLKLVEGSWAPRAPMPTERVNPISEQMQLAGDTIVSSLISGVNLIEDALEAAKLWHENTLKSTSWWLEAYANGESARRSLIYGGALAYPTGIGLSHLLQRQKMLATLSLQRHPLWENSAITNISSGAAATMPLVWNMGVSNGTAPARMNHVYLTGSGNLYRYWCGIRDDYKGTAGFTPTWECEDGTNGTDASDDADATASDGNRVTVSFATTTTLAKRSTVLVEDVVGSNYDHFMGRYLVLLRYKLSAASTTCAIQMKSGYSGMSAFAPGETVYVTDTNWRLVPLGEIKIPPWGDRENWITGIASRKFGIELWAERVSGAGSLYLDALYLIPSEHMVYVSGKDDIDLYTFPNDETIAVGEATGTIVASAEMSVRDWYIPTGGDNFVIVGERETAHDLTDTVVVAVGYYPRWLSYRDT